MSDVEGGGRLADQNIDSTLTIRQNDDPIFFSNIFFSQEEGDSFTITVVRGGQRNGITRNLSPPYSGSLSLTLLCSILLTSSNYYCPTHYSVCPTLTICPPSLLTHEHCHILTGLAAVSFAIVYQTASQEDVLVTPADNLSFQDGQSLGQIVISVVDDSLPELAEDLQIRLVSTTGDYLLQ